mmetsp:Transcript_23430/g.65173  ORF Transcript_23430/g.65173 Transcript_23430/m.65173 type:complete len:576 (+) Transcript_23430:222-1949(+)
MSQQIESTPLQLDPTTVAVLIVPFICSVAYVHFRELVAQLSAKSQDAADKTTKAIVVEKEVPSKKPEDDGTRSVRAQNFYGSYPKNTMRPWKNSRNEGREGDVVDHDKSAIKSFMDYPPDHRDVGTPDEWIPRDGRLVRLTGKHPFNCEPPVPELDKTGFLTPGNLHIIRNHGAVPKLSWETHKLHIGGGLCPKKTVLSMDELTTIFPITEFPVTISCCGNRRKEINMIKQTIGFNWGNGACGNMIYKGVLLRDLLQHVGIDIYGDVTGKYVEFIGTDDLGNKCGGPGPFPDEPWGEKVKYGTSLPLAKCLDAADEVMIAFQANGERLHPDRGYPIRLVIPGYIGGRMIKWLAKINILSHESHSCYHYWDNKYLPPQVTAEIAAKDGWWYKQEYIINELSLNSLITKPSHNETLDLKSNLGKTYEIRGYAHSGGGREVTRVEISTDQGATWNLATLNRQEVANPYGKYWCWLWWKYDLDVADLIMVGDSDNGKEIWCRAWDTSNSPQPEKPVWTLMGQSSNHIFRVKVHKEQNGAGDVVFRFEYPTQPGQQSGGWATRTADKVKSAGYGPISFDE